MSFLTIWTITTRNFWICDGVTVLEGVNYTFSGIILIKIFKNIPDMI